MLTSFGMFWTGEGAGATWPGADLFILVLIAFVLAMSAGFVATLRVNSCCSRWARTPDEVGQALRFVLVSLRHR